MSEVSRYDAAVETDAQASPEAVGGVTGGVIGAGGGTTVAVFVEGMQINAGTGDATHHTETGQQTGAPEMAKANLAEGGTITAFGLVGIAVGVSIARMRQGMKNKATPLL